MIGSAQQVLWLSWFFSPPQPYGCRAHAWSSEIQPQLGEGGAPQRQRLTNCPIAVRKELVQVSPHHRGNLAVGPALSRSTQLKCTEWETVPPAPTPTSHTAHTGSPQRGISLCFLAIPNIPHHHRHSSQLTPQCPFDGCATASKNQQQHSEAVQYPDGRMSTLWGGSIIQPQHGVQHSTPTLPSEQACLYSFLNLLIFFIYYVAQGLIYYPCYPLH